MKTNKPEIIYLDPTTLKRHRLRKHVPELFKRDENGAIIPNDEWTAFVEGLRVTGTCPPIVITLPDKAEKDADGLVVDGWNRTLAAIQLGWDKIPCEVIAPADAVLHLNLRWFGEKSTSKPARAYSLISDWGDFIAQAQNRSLKNLKNLRNPLVQSTRGTPVRGAENYRDVEKAFGLGRDTLTSVIHLWRTMNEPGSKQIKDLVGHAMSRSDIEDIQAELRREFEPQLASGKKSVWNVASAIASRFLTPAKRPISLALLAENWATPIRTLRAFTRISKDYWHKIETEEQDKIINEIQGFQDDLRQLPQEAQDRIFAEKFGDEDERLTQL